MLKIKRFHRGPLVRSAPCRQRDLSARWYKEWTARIARGASTLPADQQAVWGPVWAGMRGKWMHRKLWEWCAIAQALDERGLLAKGKSAMGFAVGREPLASLFAARGVRVLASDLDMQAGVDWAGTGQMASSLDAVRWPGLVSAEAFAERVRYENVDMRDLSAYPRASHDFVWSSCSFEHLGSLESGLQFVIEAMELVRPGGIGVHTTEYNVSSNSETVSSGDNVIYRQRDIEALDRSLRSIGCAIEGLDFDAGIDQHDLAFDFPPYYQHGRQHLKIDLMGYVSTSFLLIVRKAH